MRTARRLVKGPDTAETSKEALCKFNPKKLTCFRRIFDDVDCGDGEA